jgi:hypothetical protein
LNSVLTDIRDTRKSGFRQFPLQSEIATPNVQSSSCSLLLLQVNSTYPELPQLTNRLSGPRFALVFLWYVLTARPNSSLPKFVFWVGIFRTVTCGGWTYVTSTDDHLWHDIFMISYLVATLPWTLGCLALSPNNAMAVKYRKIFASCFFGTLVPLIYFFIQHKVHRVAGGELIRVLDVGFLLISRSLHHLLLL